MKKNQNHKKLELRNLENKESKKKRGKLKEEHEKTRRKRIQVGFHNCNLKTY